MKDSGMQKRCSITSKGGVVVVIDHQRDDMVIAPPCGVDAIAVHAYIRCSLKSGCGARAADDMIESIANGGAPISAMNPSGHQYLQPKKERIKGAGHA